MPEAYPALLVVTLGQEELPPVSEVEEVVVEALEAEWGDTRGMIRGVRREQVKFQDEIPPEPPVEVDGLKVVFGQLQVTMYDIQVSPFRVVTDALHDAFNEGDGPTEWTIEMALDAVVREDIDR